MPRILLPSLVCLALGVHAQVPSSTSPAVPPKLDGFTTGPWVGMNAVYQAKNFDATLSTDRILRIQPKHDDKPVGAPVMFRYSLYHSNGVRAVATALTAFEKQTPPAMQPAKAEFTGLHSRRERCTIAIQFSEKGVTFIGDVKDPASVKHPTALAYNAQFGPSHQIPPETPPEEVKKLTVGHTVKFYDAKRKVKTMEYWQAIPASSNTVAAAEVSGAWGPRRLSFEMPAIRESAGRIGHFHNYAVHAFYKGGWALGRNGADKVVGGPLTLKIE